MNKVLLIVGFILYTSMLHSQVTIGTAAPPSKGALLDLKTSEVEGANSTKGLLLPRVQLESRTKLLPTAGDQLEEHIGLTVYNVGPAAACIFSSIKAGVYVWSGIEWNALASDINADPGVAANAQIYRTVPNGEVVTGQKVTLTVGGSARFVGHANGDGLSYVWYKEGTTPPTAKNNDGSLVLANLELTDQGIYHCRIYDSCDEYITRSVTVNVEAVTCIPITIGGIRVSGQVANPVAPNTYNVDLWDLEETGENTYNKEIYISLLPYDSGASGVTIEWTLDGVVLNKKTLSLILLKQDLKIGQSILTYTAKQNGCADQPGVIVLNLAYDCSKQDINSYIVYDKAANPNDPNDPILHQDIYNSIERVISPTGDITYKVAVNKDKLAADRMIYVPFYKKFFKEDGVHTNEKAYDGVRKLLNSPFAPNGGLELEVPLAGQTWTTVEKFYDQTTQCTYVATFEVKIADSDCELVAFTGITASLSNDPADPFMEMLYPRIEPPYITASLDLEQSKAVTQYGVSIFMIVSTGDMSKVESITVTHPSFASHIDHGNGIFQLDTTQISSDGTVFTIRIKTTDSSCPIIERKFEVRTSKKNPDD